MIASIYFLKLSKNVSYVSLGLTQVNSIYTVSYIQNLYILKNIPLAKALKDQESFKCNHEPIYTLLNNITLW